MFYTTAVRSNIMGVDDDIIKSFRRRFSMKITDADILRLDDFEIEDEYVYACKMNVDAIESLCRTGSSLPFRELDLVKFWMIKGDVQFQKMLPDVACGPSLVEGICSAPIDWEYCEPPKDFVEVKGEYFDSSSFDVTVEGPSGPREVDVIIDNSGYCELVSSFESGLACMVCDRSVVVPMIPIIFVIRREFGDDYYDRVEVCMCTSSFLDMPAFFEFRFYGCVSFYRRFDSLIMITMLLNAGCIHKNPGPPKVFVGCHSPLSFPDEFSTRLEYDLKFDASCFERGFVNIVFSSSAKACDNYLSPGRASLYKEMAAVYSLVKTVACGYDFNITSMNDDVYAYQFLAGDVLDRDVIDKGIMCTNRVGKGIFFMKGYTRLVKAHYVYDLVMSGGKVIVDDDTMSDSFLSVHNFFVYLSFYCPSMTGGGVKVSGKLYIDVIFTCKRDFLPFPLFKSFCGCNFPGFGPDSFEPVVAVSKYERPPLRDLDKLLKCLSYKEVDRQCFGRGEMKFELEFNDWRGVVTPSRLARRVNTDKLLRKYMFAFELLILFWLIFCAIFHLRRG